MNNKTYWQSLLAVTAAAIVSGIVFFISKMLLIVITPITYHCHIKCLAFLLNPLKVN